MPVENHCGNLEKEKTYKRYPILTVLLFNTITILVYLLGSFGIMLGYNFSWAGNIVGYIYFIFAGVQMVLILPIFVCPNCVYFHMDGSRCMSALNIFSKRIAKPGNEKDFFKRQEGLLCSNHLSIIALFIPVLIMIHALIFNFSLLLLMVFLLTIDLITLRSLVILPKMICKYCLARQNCPSVSSEPGSDTDS